MTKGVNKCLPSFLFTDEINVLVITEEAANLLVQSEVANLLVQSKVIKQYFMKNVVVTVLKLFLKSSTNLCI